MSARVLCAVGAIALIAGCAKSTEETQVLSPEFAASRGYDAYNDGNLPRAEAYFEIALEADPDNPYARLGLDEVRASLDDRTRAAQVVQASRKPIADTPDRFARVTRERIEQPIAASAVVAAPAVVPEPAVTQVVEAVVETVEVVAPSSPSPYVGTINVETAPVMIVADEPVVSISPNPPLTVDSEDTYQTVGSYEAYLAALEPATEPDYIASAPAAPLVETGVAFASMPVESIGYVEQASLDPVPVVETVAVIPDPAPLDYTTVATAYPVQAVLQYGEPLNFADEGDADVAVQAFAADGGQGVTVAASGPAGGATVYAPTLDGVAWPVTPDSDAGAQSIQPEAWALSPLSITDDLIVLK